MSFTITIDKRKILVDEGCTLIDAAADHGVYIPSLCYTRGKPCLGTCRVCSVRVNGKVTAACTVPVQPGMVVEVKEPRVTEMRKLLVEALFSEGNHNCPSCEKSGRCELQAVAYEVEMTASPFPYRFPKREREDAAEHIFLERDRCIFCQRCVEHVRDEETGQAIFAIHGRGTKARIEMDVALANKLSPEQAHAAAELCPVGCILEKGVGFAEPMGERKFDVKSLRKRALEGEPS